MFYYRGEKFTPSMVVDPEEIAHTGHDFSGLYPIIARHNSIDLYSYEYEMMQAEPITFSDPTGLAVAFVAEGNFDTTGYSKALMVERHRGELTQIAEKHFGDNANVQSVEIMKALITAFTLGLQVKG